MLSGDGQLCRINSESHVLLLYNYLRLYYKISPNDALCFFRAASVSFNSNSYLALSSAISSSFSDNLAFQVLNLSVKFVRNVSSSSIPLDFPDGFVLLYCDPPQKRLYLACEYNTLGGSAEQLHNVVWPVSMALTLRGISSQVRHRARKLRIILQCLEID
jgi:hypothetical protein